jgi:hypothetical protein
VPSPTPSTHVVCLQGRTIDHRHGGIPRNDRSQTVRASSHCDKHHFDRKRFVVPHNFDRLFCAFVSRGHPQFGVQSQLLAILFNVFAVLLVRRTFHQDHDQVVVGGDDMVELIHHPLEVAFYRVQIGGGHSCQVAVHLLVHRQPFVAGRPQAPTVRVDDVSDQDFAWKKDCPVTVVLTGCDHPV